MPRVKITTNIEEELILKAKAMASNQGFDGANAVIEAALRLYFANCMTEVWEKHLGGGWFKKLVVRPEKVMFESIRTRKSLGRFTPSQFTPEALEARGWKRVWKMKKSQTD